MNRRLSGLVFAVAIVAFSPPAAAQSQPAEAPKGKERKIPLRHTWKVGDKLLLVVRIHQERPVMVGIQTQELWSNTVTSEIAISVMAGREPDERELLVTFRRIRHLAEHDGKKTTSDTDRPEDASRGNFFAPLKGFPFKAVLRDGKIGEIAGIEKLLEMQEKLWSSPL
jgi:hypothetical protein